MRAGPKPTEGDYSANARRRAGCALVDCPVGTPICRSSVHYALDVPFAAGALRVHFILVVGCSCAQTHADAEPALLVLA